MRKIRDCVPDGYARRLRRLVCSTIKAETEEHVPPSYLVKTLYTYGRLVYVPYEPLKGFYRGAPLGVPDRYGRYHNFTVYTENGLSLGEVQGVELRANVDAAPPYLQAVRRCALLDRIDAAIERNVNTSTTPRVIPGNKEMKKELEIVLASIDDGCAVIVPDSIHAALEAADISTPFLADALNDLRSQVWSDLLKDVGVFAAANYKRERVQTSEVNASAGEAIDSVYMLIDQANADAEFYGVPVHFSFNGYAARFDDDGEEVLENV